MNFETAQYKGVSIHEVLDELMEHGESVIERPREDVLNEVPKAEDLEKLHTLPFEVSIRSQGQRLILATGQKYQAIPVQHMDVKFLTLDEKMTLYGTQRNDSKVDFHSHPYLEYPTTSLFPSDGDYLSQVLAHKWAKKDEKIRPMLIASKDSLIVVSGRTDRDMKKAYDILSPEIFSCRETIQELLSKVDEKNEEKIVDVLKKLTDSVREYLEIRFIPWNEAQEAINDHIGFIKD